MKDQNEMNIEVKKMKEMTVAYVRHIGPYKGDGALFDQLIQKPTTWAGPRELLRFPDTRLMAVYHDNPKITTEDN